MTDLSREELAEIRAMEVNPESWLLRAINQLERVSSERDALREEVRAMAEEAAGEDL
jgi:uncharacterized protein (UPF0335 family)